MPILIEYKCFKCGIEFDVLWRDSEGKPKSAICECGNKAGRLYNSQIIIDDWSPMTNDGRRDIEHFEKMKSRGMGRAIYQDDKEMSAAYKKDKKD